MQPVQPPILGWAGGQQAAVSSTAEKILPVSSQRGHHYSNLPSTSSSPTVSPSYIANRQSRHYDHLINGGLVAARGMSRNQALFVGGLKLT